MRLDVRSFILIAGITFFMGMIESVPADGDEGNQSYASVVGNSADEQKMTLAMPAKPQVSTRVTSKRGSAPSRGKGRARSKGLEGATSKGVASKKVRFQLSPEEIELLKSLSTTPPQEEPAEATEPEEFVDESDSSFAASEFAYKEPTKTSTLPTGKETTTSEMERFLKSLEEKKEKKDGSPQK